jgi:hypothetical protein
VANAFVNGTTVITLPPLAAPNLALPSTTCLRLGGILTPLSFPEIVVDFGGAASWPFEITQGTPTGGLIPGLLSLGPQLA